MDPVEVSPQLGIAAVERDTGLSKDLLRVWERRYGFPTPLRDVQGERLYPLEQVQRLRQIKRLIDAGHRPHQVVSLDAPELQARLQALQERPATTPLTAAVPEGAELDRLLAPLFNHQPHELLDALQAELLRLGLERFIIELLAPLIERVGRLWADGRVQIHEEHLFSEVVQQQLRRALAQLGPALGARPRVLLSTLPGEEHGLGLLMVHCLLAAAGCECRSLGLQTPLPELAQACARHEADVLALSFSSYASPSLVEEGLQTLHASLAEPCELWAGGRAAGLRRPFAQRLGRLRVLAELPELGRAVQAWRNHEGPATKV
ncbi:MerR family transcriptional regulator [Inhella sp.]|uniref:MerR family transcriptional regulator n=1 Tax=Inhella sp. TaxID=1921806 RepID=UPI0035AD7C97